MSNEEELSHESLRVGDLSNSRLAKVLLLILALLYLLASVAAFVAVTVAPRNQSSFQLRSELARHGLQHALVAFLCGSAFVFLLRRSKFAELATGFAACVTSFVAVKALASSMVTGFHPYHLVEPLLVFPSVGFLLWRVIWRKAAG